MPLGAAGEEAALAAGRRKRGKAGLIRQTSCENIRAQEGNAIPLPAVAGYTADTSAAQI